MLDRLETDNLRQIEALNQRGGRTLSVVDLIDANTLDVEMAAYLLCCVANGASFLTAANPGGAGKSTVLATLLNFMPPGTQIVTTSGSAVIESELHREPREPTCVLAHEIGAGRWFGYIWGQDVADFFRLMDGPRRIASCQHADTLDEMKGVLLSRTLNVSERQFLGLDLALFMHVDGGFLQARRRVCAIHESSGTDHPMVFQWTRKGDRFEQLDDSVLLPRLAKRQGKSTQEVMAELSASRELIQELVEDDVRLLEDVRERVVEHYRR